MFTWICPKCGSEVQPAYSECPRCAEAQGRAAHPPKPPAAPPKQPHQAPPPAPPAPQQPVYRPPAQAYPPPPQQPPYPPPPYQPAPPQPVYPPPPAYPPPPEQPVYPPPPAYPPSPEQPVYQPPPAAYHPPQEQPVYQPPPPPPPAYHPPPEQPPYQPLPAYQPPVEQPAYQAQPAYQPPPQPGYEAAPQPFAYEQPAAAHSAYELPEPKRRLPSWLIALLVFAALGGALYGAYRLFGGSDAESAKSKAASPAAIAGEEGAHPFRRHLEITGLRLFEDARKNVVLRYVVVNHSPADMAGVELRILLTTTVADENAPALAEITAKAGDIPSRGSKEMESRIQTTLRAYELPDRQFLVARFSVTAPSN